MPCYVLITFPNTLRVKGREEKKGEGCAKGSTLKNEGNGRKRVRRRKKMHREGKNIFSKVLGKVFNNVMPWNLPQHLEKLGEGNKKEKGKKMCWGRFSEGKEKWGEGKRKIKERATFLKLKYFNRLYWQLVLFKKLQLQGASSMTPIEVKSHQLVIWKML